MSAPQFTPGPWVTDNDGNVGTGQYAENRIAEPMGDTHEQAEANGHLIASAPDLYALLSDIAEQYTMLIRFTDSTHIYEIEKQSGKRVRKSWREVFCTECEAGRAKINDFLAKARGEQ